MTSCWLGAALGQHLGFQELPAWLAWGHLCTSAFSKLGFRRIRKGNGMHYITIGEKCLSSYAFDPKPGEAYALFFNECDSTLRADLRAFTLADEMGSSWRLLSFDYQEDPSNELLLQSLQKMWQRGFDPSAIVVATPWLTGKLWGPDYVGEEEYASCLRGLREQLRTHDAGASFVPLVGERFGKLSANEMRKIAGECGFVVCEVSMGMAPIEDSDASAGGAPQPESLLDRCKLASCFEDFARLVRELDGREGEEDRKEVLACAKALAGSLGRAYAEDAPDYREILSVCVPGPNAGTNPNAYLSELYMAAFSGLFELGLQSGSKRAYEDLDMAIVLTIAQIESLSYSYLWVDGCDFDDRALRLADMLVRFRELIEATDSDDESFMSFKLGSISDLDGRIMECSNRLLVELVSTPCDSREEALLRIRTVCVLGTLIGYCGLE